MGRQSTNNKQVLIETAIELMWKNSYGSVSVDEICKTADINKGSFYYYFKSKAELAVAALESYYEEKKPLFDDIFSPTFTPKERFERMADRALENQKEVLEKYGHVCGCPFLTLGSEMAGQNDNIRNEVDLVCRRYERYFESALNDLIKEGSLDKNTDTKDLSQQIHGFILGQMTLARIQNSLAPLESNLKEGVLRIAGIFDSNSIKQKAV